MGKDELFEKLRDGLFNAKASKIGRSLSQPTAKAASDKCSGRGGFMDTREGCHQKTRRDALGAKR